MNRNKLITDIAQKTQNPPETVSEFVKAYEDLILEALSNGEPVLLHNFMRIERKEKKEYIGHGFGKDELKVIPKHDYIKIRPGKALIDCVK